MLAWALELELEGGDEPLTLGILHVVPVLRIVEAADPEPSPSLRKLRDALLRLRLRGA